MEKTLEFVNILGKKVKVKLYKAYYTSNDALAIIATNEDGSPYGRATVNIEYALTIIDRQVIMDINNNRALFEAMLKEGIISEPISFIGSGFCLYPICSLLVDLPDLPDN